MHNKLHANIFVMANTLLAKYLMVVHIDIDISLLLNWQYDYPHNICKSSVFTFYLFYCCCALNLDPQQNM